ncbi:MAG: hypothetical protein MI741_00080, partial [Rhodospirillales bacterium]|nr:hypothetical protein [Rhodospirillales bacterium]
TGKPWHSGGFDKISETQLAVEAIKVRTEPYFLDREFDYNKTNKGGHFGDPLGSLKLPLFWMVSRAVDVAYAIVKRSGLIRLLKVFYH